MTPPTLRLVESLDDATIIEEADQAWRIIVAGYEDALRQLSPGHPDRPLFLQCRNSGLHALNQVAVPEGAV